MRRVLNLLDKALVAVAGALLAAVTFTVLLQVTMRYVFNAPTSWSEELATLLFVWLVMIGIPPVLRHGQHIKVDVLAELPIRGIRRVLNILGNVVFAIVFAVLGYYAIQLMPSADRQLLTGISRALGVSVPMSAINWAVPVGSVFTVVYAIEQIIAPLPSTVTEG